MSLKIIRVKKHLGKNQEHQILQEHQTIKLLYTGTSIYSNIESGTRDENQELTVSHIEVKSLQRSLLLYAKWIWLGNPLKSIKNH